MNDINKNNKLKKRAIGGILLSIFLSLSTLVVIFFKLKEDSVKHMKEVTEQIVYKVDNQYKLYFDELLKLSNNLEKQNNNINQMETDVHKYANGTAFSSFHIVDDKGNTICEDGKNVYLGDRYYIKQALKGKTTMSKPLSTRIVNDKKIDSKIVCLSTPIKKNNKIIGVLVGTIPQSKINNYLKSNIYGYESNIYVFNEQHNLVMTSISDKNNILGMSERKKINHNNVEIVKYNDIRQYTICKYFKTLKGWHLVATIPVSDVQYNTINILFIVSIILLLVNGLVIYSVIKSSKNKQRLEKTAYIDRLTNLPNINYFIDKLPEVVAKLEYSSYYIISYKVENYHSIISLFGKKMGKDFSIKVAEKFAKKAEKLNTLFGIKNNDSFYLLVGADQLDAINTYITNIEKSIINDLTVLTNESQFHLSSKVGVVELNSTYDIDVPHYIELADIARDKCDCTKENYVLYNPTMMDEIERKYKIQSSIDEAIKNNEFRVLYQPKINVNDESLSSVEALIRWNSSQLNEYIAPSEFIELAEQNGKITNITLYVFKQVCKDLSEWQKNNHNVKVSVNISKIDLYHENFITSLLQILDEYHVDINLITLELTESVVDFDVDYIQAKISEMKKYGFKISLDDFGTGTSSFSIIQSIDIDELKIDRLFMLELEENDKTKILLEEIISFCKKMQIKTVCEGVENKEQVELLKTIGCDIIQGYYYYKPLSKEELTKIMK